VRPADLSVEQLGDVGEWMREEMLSVDMEARRREKVCRAEVTTS
jgi:hypothetical protein